MALRALCAGVALPRALLLAVLLAVVPAGGATYRDSGVFPVEGGHAYKPQLYCSWIFDEAPTKENRDCLVNETAPAVTHLRVRVAGAGTVFAKLDRQVWFNGNLTWEQLAVVRCSTSFRATCDAPLLGEKQYKERFRLFVRVEEAEAPAVVEAEAVRLDPAFYLP